MSTPPNEVETLLAKVQQSQTEVLKAQKEAAEAKARETQAKSKTLKDAKADEVNAELMQFADAQARENVILRTAMEFGLKPTDLEGDYQSPNEVKFRAEAIVSQQRLDQLLKDLTEQRTKLEDVASKVASQVDSTVPTGTEGSGFTQGQTAIEASAQGGAEQPSDYDLAKKQGRTKEGRMRLLQAVYRDPTKRVVGQQH